MPYIRTESYMDYAYMGSFEKPTCTSNLWFRVLRFRKYESRVVDLARRGRSILVSMCINCTLVYGEPRPIPSHTAFLGWRLCRVPYLPLLVAGISGVKWDCYIVSPSIDVVGIYPFLPPNAGRCDCAPKILSSVEFNVCTYRADDVAAAPLFHYLGCSAESWDFIHYYDFFAMDPELC